MYFVRMKLMLLDSVKIWDTKLVELLKNKNVFTSWIGIYWCDCRRTNKNPIDNINRDSSVNAQIAQNIRGSVASPAFNKMGPDYPTYQANPKLLIILIQ